MLASRWIAALGVLGVVVATGIACGPFSEPDETRLFDPATGASAEMSGLLFDTRSAGFGVVYSYVDQFRTQNALEWRGWLGSDTAASREWESLLFGSSPARVDSLIDHLRGGAPLPATAKALCAALSKPRLLGALDYARAALLWEPVLTSRTSEETWGPSRALPTHSDSLFASGLAKAQKEKDPFLRQRWFFLLEKYLFHTRSDWALIFLEQHANELKGPSPSLWWRSRMDKAGLLRESDALAANLEYARVAAAFPPLAEMAANDFLVVEDSSWQAALSQASPPDRASLLFLAGLRSFDPAFIEWILATDSSSAFVALLAARHIGRWEIEYPPDNQAPKSQDSSIAPLKRLARSLAPSRRTSSPCFWNLLAGHFEAIQGNQSKALSFLDSADKLSRGDSALRNQIRISRTIAKLLGAKSPTPALEAYLMQEIPRIDSSGHRSYGFEEFYRRETARIWKRDTACSFLLSHRSSASSKVLARMTKYWEQADAPFDRFVKARSGVNDSILRTHWGMSLIYDDRYAEGLAQLERSGTAETIGTDPFNAEITDDHDRDHQRFSLHPESRLSYARELVNLQARAKQGGPEGAKAALRLGIGLYNRTHFGNSRTLMSGLDFADPQDPRWFRLEPARKAFAQAAKDLPSAEGRAWATWLLAKCERDQANDGSRPSIAYAQLRSRYQKTPFWRRALKECGWLRDWNSGRPSRS